MREKKTKNKITIPGPLSDLILNNIDEVVYYATINSKGEKKLAFLSDKIKPVLGITKQKYLSLGAKILDYCHPDDIPDIVKKTTIVLKKKIKGDFRYRFYNLQKKGYVWLEETIYPQMDNKKKLIGYFGVSRNIESLIEHEQTLSESEKKFRLLAENSSDIIFHFQFKPKAAYTYVSPAVKKILGYTPENFYKDPLIGFKIIHPADREQLLSSQQNIIDKKAVIKTYDKLAARYVTKSGKTVWLENRYSPVYKGKEIVALHCVSRDITEQKQNEEELSQRWLNYKNLIESLPTGIFIHVNGKIIFGNKEAYRIAEIGKNEDLDKFSLIDFLLPKDRAQGIARIKTAMSGKDTPFIEYHITTRKGAQRVIRTKSSPILYNATQAVQIIIQDITREKKLEEERVKAKTTAQINKGLREEVNLRVQSEEKLKAIFNSSSHLIWTIGKKFEITSYNSKYAQIVKEQCGVLLKANTNITSFKKYFTPAEYKRFKSKYAEAFKGKNQQFEIKFTAVDGTERFREIFLHPTRIKDKVIEVAAIAQDVTERRNNETQIIEQAAKLNAIFESTSQLVWTINKDKEVVSYNKQYAAAIKNLCGKKMEPGVKTTAFKQVFSDKDYSLLQFAHNEAFNGRSTKIEIPLNAIDGKTYYREMHFHPILINGKVNEIAAVAQDTTERRSYEKQIIEQSAKLKAIFDSGSQRIWTVNKDFAFTSFNDNFADSFVGVFGKRPKLYTSALEQVKGTEYYDFWKNKYQVVLNGESLEFETKHVDRSGRKMYGQVFFHPIVNEKGEVLEIAAISQDITDRKKAEKRIIEQSARLKAIFESGAQLMWTVNKNLALTSFNKNYSDAIYNMYGVHPEINLDPNKPKKKFASDEYHKFWEDKYREVFKGKSIAFDTERESQSGEKIYRHIFLHPIFNERNEIVEVSGVGYDITEQRGAQEEILSKQSQLSAIINTTGDIIFSVDKDFKIVEFNNVLKNIVKERSGQEANKGVSIFDYIPHENYADLKNTYNKALKGENIVTSEVFIVSGERRIYEAHYNPIIIGGKITGIAIFSRDVTEQKRNEDEILKSLKEKDVLLKEIHHRVKNNLQVISSILNLQTAYLKDKATINILKECQNRIKTMAFIHESLYQNKDFSQINFSEYIVTLVKNLFYSFEANQQKIRANFDVEPILLNLDTSIPCGLIVNELVSNALKYAFKDREEGVVFIELKKINNKIKMVVADNGKGMPDNINYKNTETLGLQLVNTLTEQINGTISMKRNKGTIFEIIF